MMARTSDQHHCSVPSTVNAYPDIQSAEDYAQYQADVAEFFKREGLANLAYDADKYPEGCVEPHFSWSPCDCCGRQLGGDRVDCSGYNPTTNEVQDDYQVCPDCIYYVEYGRLDDTTMLRIEG